MNIANLPEPTVKRIVCEQMTEDMNRKPHEKELGLHAAGDDDYFLVSSFKRVVYGKLLQQPAFNATQICVVDPDGREDTVDSLGVVLDNPELTIIGVIGQIPVGAVNIGTPRRSNSHADIVK